MKAMLVLLLALALPLHAEQKNAPASASATNPPAFLFDLGARHVSRSGDGYRLTMPNGRPVYVDRTPSGYRVGTSGHSTYADATRDGWRVNAADGSPTYWRQRGNSASSGTTHVDYSRTSVRIRRGGEAQYYSTGPGGWSSTRRW